LDGVDLVDGIPSGGVASDSYEIALALIPNDDFGEIIDNAKR